jgi:acylphosphatase
MKTVRAHVQIEGRVQGVCFRMETQRAANQRNLSGWVKNLPDGRVEAVFEGNDSDVKSMLNWCETGPPLARVDRVALSWEPCTGKSGTFKITY